jgi:hypothetical protein
MDDWFTIHCRVEKSNNGKYRTSDKTCHQLTSIGTDTINKGKALALTRLIFKQRLSFFSSFSCLARTSNSTQLNYGQKILRRRKLEMRMLTFTYQLLLLVNIAHIFSFTCTVFPTWIDFVFFFLKKKRGCRMGPLRRWRRLSPC